MSVITAGPRRHVTSHKPTLSEAIRQLERELAVPLVDRNGRRFGGLTPEGKRILGWAREILASEDALRQEPRLTKGPLAKGYFVPPTVFADVRDDMRIAQEEIFGPVISAIPFKDMDELVQRANATMFGLGSGVWTRDVSNAHHLASAIRAGSVWVNCYQAMDPAVPFGGYKMSGTAGGRDSSRWRSISTSRRSGSRPPEPAHIACRFSPPPLFSRLPGKLAEELGMR